MSEAIILDGVICVVDGVNGVVVSAVASRRIVDCR
jgi:hypothetical protein